MPDFRDPLILAIESATRAGSVALARGSKILASAQGNAVESHSISLLESIESVLQAADAKLGDVDLFAAACGPGSFTGLRIGLATTKAFAVCSGKQCAGISTLAAIAHAAGESEHTVALLPAGRGELFAQLFKVADSSVKPLDSPAHLVPAAVIEKYRELKQAVFAGDGAYLHAVTFNLSEMSLEFGKATEGPGPSSGNEESWTLAPRCDQLAASVAALALNEYTRGNLVEPDELQASYVRPSDAEINERWQQLNAQS